MKLQKQLKFWFTVHFAIDVVFALALFIEPAASLEFLGWQSVDPIASRLVAAALFGIGIESFIGRNSTLDSFKTMLTLKVIWSFTAVVGIAISLVQNAQGRPPAAFGLMAVFIAFHVLWVSFLVRVRGEVNPQSPKGPTEQLDN